MHKRFSGPVERLRDPSRVELLEVERVVDLSLGDDDIRSMLDVGIGTGLFAEAFAARGIEIAGVDADPDMIVAARRYLPDADFEVGLAEKLPQEDNTFDLVFLGHVLHETDDAVTALREARRVSRGPVAVLEWPYVEEESGPPLAHRLRAAHIADASRTAGFTGISQFPLQHMLLFRLEQ